MELKPIKTNKEYQTWLDWVDEQFDKKVKPESVEGEKLHAALLLIEKYEDEYYYVVPLPNAKETFENVKINELC